MVKMSRLSVANISLHSYSNLSVTSFNSPPSKAPSAHPSLTACFYAFNTLLPKGKRDLPPPRDFFLLCLGWKLLSCSQCQELGQRANLDSDWLPENKEPIRSQVSFLTQLLTLTTTQKFPPLEDFWGAPTTKLRTCRIKVRKKMRYTDGKIVKKCLKMYLGRFQNHWLYLNPPPWKIA